MTRNVQAPEQIAATRPDQSNWVSANAGSGKTHVLTQRVARLLLAGSMPQKILCLTYTKAAAAEMQTRLFQTLGSWAMEPEAMLAERLGGLSGDGPVKDPAALADARRLFARALETPGGLKIQTIHAFCDMLLRRFPLEAGISPRFEVADDRQSALLWSRIRARMAMAAENGVDPAFDRAALRLNEGGIDDLANAVLARRGPFRLGALKDRLTAHFGALATEDEESCARNAVRALDTAQLRLLAEVARRHGGAKIGALASAIEAHLPDLQARPLSVAADLGGALLRKADGAPRKDLVTKGLRAADPDIDGELAHLADWAQRTREAILGVRTIARTRDLHTFSTALMQRLTVAKTGSGLVDFDDLVTVAEALLTKRDMRAWVLFKLDQGIDHILVDEAQDTSPQQWAVIAAIAEEFLAGQGARAEARSLFVVGDEKQSIYSFQGAEPQAFGKMRDHFSRRLGALGTPMGEPKLLTSYRSAPGVLEFVDHVFAGTAGAGLTSIGDAVRHRAHRADDGARVDLWPPVQRRGAGDPPPWSDPVDAPQPDDPKAELARAVARHIAQMVAKETLPPRAGKPGRKIKPRDILVLVTKRDRLAKGIIRQLKIEDVPVAGADRMSLIGELAVQDLLALIRVVLMPSDDLSLAALLRSPLCGVCEEGLFDLAHERTGTLWNAVQTAEQHADIAAFLRDMAGQADFIRPYEFLERALVYHDGRRRLLARLGPEAEDPIDELLAQVLAYESRAAPSLTGFLAWIEAAEVDVKREMERGLDAVRVMTVHGAKGLEAPIVILPDTFSAPSGAAGRPVLLAAEATGNAPPLTIWAGPTADDDPITRAARTAQAAREAAERKRLLYVALTRAEDWLILCGAEPRHRPEGCWYALLEAGFQALPEDSVKSCPSPTGEGEVRRFETGPRISPDALGAQPEKLEPFDTQADSTFPERPPAPREVADERGSPSGLVKKAGTGGAGRGRALALRRGSAVHAVLEQLAGTPQAHRPAPGRRLLASSFPDLDAEVVDDILAEADRVLGMPEAAWLFGETSLSEVSLAIDPPGPGPRMIGRADRIILMDRRAIVVDIKTDAEASRNLADVPAAYLAQLGAYAQAVAGAWPDREVQTAILWTAEPALMSIPLAACTHAFDAASFARTGNA